VGELTYGAPAEVDTLVADLTIGTESGRAEETFGNVTAIEVGPDGTMYVLDGSLNTVRVFSAGGEYLRSISRRGQGPGELTRPRAMALAPDGALWIYDDGARAAPAPGSPVDPARAVIVFGPDGSELTRHRSTASGVAGGPLSSTWTVAFVGDGRMLQSVQRTDPLPAGVMGVLETRNRTFVRSLDPTTGAADSVLVSDDLLRRYRLRTQGPDGSTGVLLGIVPFDARRLAAIDRDGNLWTALSTEYVLERRSASGDTLIVRMDVEAPPFSPEDRASWEQSERETPRGLVLPERAHVLWRLFTDDENRLWVQRAEGFGSAGHFDVFGQNGELLGSALLSEPSALRGAAGRDAVVRGEYLYTVVYDALGISRVSRSQVPFLR
jgi:hypothetical protein